MLRILHGYKQTMREPDANELKEVGKQFLLDMLIQFNSVLPESLTATLVL